MTLSPLPLHSVLLLSYPMRKAGWRGAVAGMLLLLASCALNEEVKLSVSEADLGRNRELSGMYSMIIYGDRRHRGPEALIVLDLEGDDHRLVPNELDIYERERARSGDEALAFALEYLGYFKYPKHINIRKVLDQDGNLIGFDIRPLAERKGDLTKADYLPKKDGLVEIRVRASSPSD